MIVQLVYFMSSLFIGLTVLYYLSYLPILSELDIIHTLESGINKKKTLKGNPNYFGVSIILLIQSYIDIDIHIIQHRKSVYYNKALKSSSNPSRRVPASVSVRGTCSNSCQIDGWCSLVHSSTPSLACSCAQTLYILAILCIINVSNE